MKKIFLHVFLFWFGYAFSQNQVIPNGDFEQWTKILIEYPAGYPFNSHENDFYRNIIPPTSLQKTTDAFHGNYAVKLTTTISGQDTIFGYILNVEPNDDLSSWKGGFPITGTPTGIRGYYKAGLNGDESLIIVQFLKNGSIIASYPLIISSSASNFTLFSFTFNPPLPEAPDTVQIGFASSNPFGGNPQNGTWIILDSISFTGLTSQPAQLNGDFEIWNTDSLFKLNDWYIQGHPKGIFRTTDAYQGNYALKLKTILDGYQNVARPGSIGNFKWIYDQMLNDYFPSECKPYTRPYDTLVFAYKYFPSYDDTAQINLIFKANNSQWPVEWININITDTGVYTIYEKPFIIVTSHDSICIQISSSLWYHDSVAYGGSELYIDKLFFKSAPLVSLPDEALNKHIKLYPNPCTDYLTIEAAQPIKGISILTSEGKVLLSEQTNETKYECTLFHFPSGQYFIRIQFDDMIWYKPILKQ